MEETKLDYEIGILLYHCTSLGKADFDIQGCVQGLFNALSNKLSKQEIRYGFVAEAQNENAYELYSTVEITDEYGEIDEEEAIDPEKIDALFEETYLEYIGN